MLCPPSSYFTYAFRTGPSPLAPAARKCQSRTLYNNPAQLFRILFMNRLARLLPLFRNSLIILGAAVLALGLAYFVDVLTDGPMRPAAPSRVVTPAKPTGRAPTKEETTQVETERDERLDYELYGSSLRRGADLDDLMREGDAGLLSRLKVSFMDELKARFGDRISKEEQPDPTNDIILSEVLGSLSAHQAAQAEARAARGEPPATTADIPKAYALYEQSLATDREASIGLMDELLALPAEERKPLAAIAKYRRARLTMSLDDWHKLGDEAAKRRLAAIRADLGSVAGHAREGSLDPANISENTTYWLAYTRSMILPSERLIRMGEADFAGAFDTYLRMPRRGDANAVNSCLWLAAKLCREGRFETSVGDPDLRMLITLYLLKRRYEVAIDNMEPEVRRARGLDWLDALAAGGVDPSFAPAHVAMLQYSVDRWADCAATARLLPPSDPLRRLLLSRCNLRLRGDLAVSRRLLASDESVDLSKKSADDKMSLAAGDSTHECVIDLRDPRAIQDRVHGELGMIALAEGDFTEALRNFEEGRRLSESFYVGECLLDLEALKAYVDGRPPARRGPKMDRFYYHEPLMNLRELVGSRLMRAGRLEEALEYVNPDLRTRATGYVLLRRAAARTDLSDRERADAHWRSALLIGEIGETILHAPFGLSWSSGTGWHVSYGHLPSLRLGRSDQGEALPTMDLVGAGPEERRRLGEWNALHIEAPELSERDARYASFRHAMEAVRLLPDNDPAGAEILQYAGNLLKYREPKAAVPAYRLLVTRFPLTAHGKHALRAHWFSAVRSEPPSDLLSK
jgi:tetratricopeptide (TPR) repeat protein